MTTGTDPSDASKMCRVLISFRHRSSCAFLLSLIEKKRKSIKFDLTICCLVLESKNSLSSMSLYSSRIISCSPSFYAAVLLFNQVITFSEQFSVSRGLSLSMLDGIQYNFSRHNSCRKYGQLHLLP